MRNGALKPFEIAWQAVARLRRRLHRRGTLASRRLPRPVISVGNRSFGGSGKTPFVVALCQRLTKEGWKVCILSRGYGRENEGSIRRVIGDDAWTFGDEPVLLRRRLPGVDIMVGADRYRSGLAYLDQRDCDLFVLDDGFQHLQLERDVDIVLEPEETRLLREGASALEAADFVVRRGSGEGKVFVAPASVVCGDNRHAPRYLAGKEVVAFAGLADNDRFFEALRRLGAVVSDTVAFDDHHRYIPGDTDRLRRLRASRGAELLVTTEKDWVKIQDDDISYLEVEMIIPADLLEAIVSRVLPLVKRANR
jgi:tetraacyldisaccharide 4'-kinase